jgi:hypothetical protein
VLRYDTTGLFLSECTNSISSYTELITLRCALKLEVGIAGSVEYSMLDFLNFGVLWIKLAVVSIRGS